MTRQQWLSKFLTLVDSGAPALDYRRQLGIGFGVLHNHIASISEYRKELEELNKEAVSKSIKNPRLQDGEKCSN